MHLSAVAVDLDVGHLFETVTFHQLPGIKTASAGGTIDLSRELLLGYGPLDAPLGVGA